MSEEEHPPLQKFYFTFGMGHHHGPEKKRLGRHYTTIKATSMGVATAIMQLRRGPCWSHCYPDAKAAGVTRFALKLILFDDLLPQEGRTE